MARSLTGCPFRGCVENHYLAVPGWQLASASARHTVVLAAAILLAVFAFYLPAQAAPAQTSPADLVRKVVANELRTENADHSHWMFRLETQKPNGPKEVDEVVETKSGDLKRPILINGQPLNQSQQQQADRQLEQQARNPDLLRKSQKDQSEDEARSQRMLKLLPDAFLYTYGEHRDNLVELKFTPNPHFNPPNREAEVFHAMQGSLWVDSKQLRLAEISGRLMREVKFGLGLLGHLDKGGQFDVKQAEVAPGYWELTVLNVQMRGKALFFKTINVQQYMARSDFKLLSPDLTLAQGADLLRKETKSRSAEKSGSTMRSGLPRGRSVQLDSLSWRRTGRPG